VYKEKTQIQTGKVSQKMKKDPYNTRDVVESEFVIEDGYLSEPNSLLSFSSDNSDAKEGDKQESSETPVKSTDSDNSDFEDVDVRCFVKTILINVAENLSDDEDTTSLATHETHETESNGEEESTCRTNANPMDVIEDTTVTNDCKESKTGSCKSSQSSSTDCDKLDDSEIVDKILNKKVVFTDITTSTDSTESRDVKDVTKNNIIHVKEATNINGEPLTGNVITAMENNVTTIDDAITDVLGNEMAMGTERNEAAACAKAGTSSEVEGEHSFSDCSDDDDENKHINKELQKRRMTFAAIKENGEELWRGAYVRVNNVLRAFGRNIFSDNSKGKKEKRKISLKNAANDVIKSNMVDKARERLNKPPPKEPVPKEPVPSDDGCRCILS